MKFKALKLVLKLTKRVIIVKFNLMQKRAIFFITFYI